MTRPIHWLRVLVVAAATSLFCAYHASHAEREACASQSPFAVPASPVSCLGAPSRL